MTAPENKSQPGVFVSYRRSDTNPVVRDLKGELVSVLGDPAVRNRGTLGGNIAHADPAKVEAVWAMSHRYPEAPEDPVPQVIRTARTQLIPEIPDELLRRFVHVVDRAIAIGRDDALAETPMLRMLREERAKRKAEGAK